MNKTPLRTDCQRKTTFPLVKNAALCPRCWILVPLELKEIKNGQVRSSRGRDGRFLTLTDILTAADAVYINI